MPRTYIRKTNRQNWPEEDMLKALNAVKNGMPYKTASREFSVPLMALKRRAKGKNKFALGSVKIFGSRRTVFSLEQERELVAHIKNMESRMYELTTRDILSLAYQLAEKNTIMNPFSENKEKAGIDWLKGFRKRNPDITLRAPESTSTARARAFNKPVVDNFFSILKDTQEKHSFPPHRIFNVDETSLCTVPTKNSKVFAQTGRKQVARVTSAERGDTTTAVICTSASGNFIPPMFIFRRVRMKTELMDGAPPGSTFACNTSGWMKLDVFSQWFDHFLSHVKPSEEDPALLISDGHLSHTKNFNVVLKARDNHITILCLPPHCTHKLQPLDVGVMYPLSIYHDQALEKWMNNNPGRVVTVFQITKIFGEAYLKAAVPLNSMNGFAKCGIYPFNPDIFTDVDYIAAETTDMEIDEEPVEQPDFIPEVAHTSPTEPMQTTTPPTSIQGLASESPVSSQSFFQVTIEESLHVTPPIESHANIQDHFEKTPQISVQESVQKFLEVPESSRQVPLLESSSVIQQLLPKKPMNILHSDSQPSSFKQPIRSPLSPILSTTLANSNFNSSLPMAVDYPSTSFAVFTPSQIQPMPKIVGRRSNVRRVRVDTSVLTSTPYKNYLEEETKKKTEKEQKATKKENKIKKPAASKKKNKTTGGGKGKKQKKRSYESDSSHDEDIDAECLFCTETYSKDNKGEGWIRCVACLKWGHEACAGIDSDDGEDFTCDFCVSNSFNNAKKKLRL